MLARRPGQDAGWFEQALQAKGVRPCIPSRKSPLEPVRYGKRRHRRQSRIVIMFGRLQDWRRVVSRYDRFPTVFFSAVAPQQPSSSGRTDEAVAARLNDAGIDLEVTGSLTRRVASQLPMANHGTGLNSHWITVDRVYAAGLRAIA